MSYTETTTTSWFSRLGSSFSGMGLGLVLLIAGTVLLWWNEGDFVATRDALNEAQSVTQKVSDISRVDPALNGKLIHASGFADTQDVLQDPVFGIAERAIALQRKVEYYQWVEESKQEKRQKLGGGEETITTYTYSKQWVSSPVDSSGFREPGGAERYANTVHMSLEDNTQRAGNVSFGAYRLPDFFISSMNRFEPVRIELAQEVRENLKRQLQPGRTPYAASVPGSLALNSNARYTPGPRPIEIVSDGSTIYIGPSPTTPSVGDMRVTFQKVMPADVSILAQVNGSTFEPYYASNGETVSALRMGRVSMENMYGAKHSSNSTMTWIFRAGGALLVIAGLKMLVAPLTVLASVIPLLGSIVGAGTGLVCTLLGAAWSLIIISIAWLRFRPVIGGIMLGIALVLIVLLYLKGRGKKAAAQAPVAS